jgi:hypothetical protein
MATAADEPAHSDVRFKRTVERICAEAYWLNTYQSAIDGMKGVDAIGLDFFRVALNALKDARLIRLIRILEDDSQTASFWYLLKSNASLLTRAASAAGLDLSELRRIADALRGVRDKTFVHIDKDGVFDPQSYYLAANLNNDDVGRVIRLFWKAMRALHVEVFRQRCPTGHL